jgi:hypothetical protein
VECGIDRSTEAVDDSAFDERNAESPDEWWMTGRLGPLALLVVQAPPERER